MEHLDPGLDFSLALGLALSLALQGVAGPDPDLCFGFQAGLTLASSLLYFLTVLYFFCFSLAVVSRSSFPCWEWRDKPKQVSRALQALRCPLAPDWLFLRQ